MFAAIREGDILLHHPYDSFDPVIQFVQQAARDPKVLAIKQTLYRTTGQSPIVRSLVEAAEAEKQVAALIELKARFDEENNINWARNLERVGAHVVYGFPGLKVHCKVILVVRDEPEGIRRYVHFGTGNYNEKTAKLYTDLSYFTCRPEIGGDATYLFNRLTGFSKDTRYAELMVAPTTLRSGFEALIERERRHASPDAKPASRRSSMRSPTAACARRCIALRKPACRSTRSCAACANAAGHPRGQRNDPGAQHRGPLPETLRIYVFENDGDREIYIGSADWMGRNLDRRVETIVPVTDRGRQAQILAILEVMHADNVKTRWLLPDGTYQRRVPADGEPLLSAQDCAAPGRRRPRPPPVERRLGLPPPLRTAAGPTTRSALPGFTTVSGIAASRSIAP